MQCNIIYISCINIYAYSCLKLLSNRSEAVFKQKNPCSNHEIRMLFEYGFSLKAILCLRDVTCRCPCSNNCKAFCQRHSSFSRNDVIVSMYQNGSRISTGFQWVFTVLMLFSVRFSIESLRKCKNNDHTCLFQCINICHISRKQFDPSADLTLLCLTSLPLFKHL